MNSKPKYLLVTEGRKAESEDLGEIMRLAKNITAYYEIFKCYTPYPRSYENKKILTAKDIEDARRMQARGYKKEVIAKRIGISVHIAEKILVHDSD